MIKGQDLLDLAATRVGESYIFGANVETADPEWHGPWDCAEFVTWVVYQLTRQLYGCVENENPVNCDAYTGAWVRDVKTELVKRINTGEASLIAGAILLRAKTSIYCGHIVFSDGKGGTVEAADHIRGVCRSHAAGRIWNYGILIPGINY